MKVKLFFETRLYSPSQLHQAFTLVDVSEVSNKK